MYNSVSFWDMSEEQPTIEVNQGKHFVHLDIDLFDSNDANLTMMHVPENPPEGKHIGLYLRRETAVKLHDKLCDFLSQVDGEALRAEYLAAAKEHGAAVERGFKALVALKRAGIAVPDVDNIAYP